MIKWISIALLLCDADGQSRTNFVLKRIDVCMKDSPIYYSANFTTESDGEQYLDLTTRLPFALDDNYGSLTNIESAVNGKNYLPLFTIREPNFCKGMNKYLGEFWYDLQRAIHLQQGACPIPQGRYQVRHHLLDYHKIALQTFPFGSLKFKIHVTDKSNRNKNIFCLLAEVENVFQ